VTEAFSEIVERTIYRPSLWAEEKPKASSSRARAVAEAAAAATSGPHTSDSMPGRIHLSWCRMRRNRGVVVVCASRLRVFFPLQCSGALAWRNLGRVTRALTIFMNRIKNFRFSPTARLQIALVFGVLRSLDRFECSKAPRVVGTCRPPVTPQGKTIHLEHCLPIRVLCRRPRLRPTPSRPLGQIAN
jgi:hypothetical protein